MPIRFFAEDIKSPKIPKRKITNWIKAIAKEYGKNIGEIGYIFCSDKKILEVNNEYLHHDYYTDIITFDYSEDNIIAGDIFISVDTVKSNSEEYKTKYDDEMARIIIHGILHLCGLKDKEPKEEKQMREAENKALQVFANSQEEK